MNMKIIAVDIGGTEIKGALFDVDLIAEHSIQTDSSQGKTSIMRTLNSLINHLWVEDVRAIGIVTAGAVDIKTGKIVNNVGTLDGWLDFSIKDEIQNIYHVPCFVENDANGAMIAEMAYHHDIKNACMITLGTGVGTAVYLNGELYRGEHYKLEFGHSILIPDGNQCTCGLKGCAESYLSGAALKKRAMEELNVKMDHGIELFDYYKNGNEYAKKVIEEYTDLLALFLSNISHFYDPEIIIIGGGVIHSKDTLFPFINKKIKHLESRVVPAKLGNFAGIKGAHLLVLKEMKHE